MDIVHVEKKLKYDIFKTFFRCIDPYRYVDLLNDKKM